MTCHLVTAKILKNIGFLTRYVFLWAYFIANN